MLTEELIIQRLTEGPATGPEIHQYICGALAPVSVAFVGRKLERLLKAGAVVRVDRSTYQLGGNQNHDNGTITTQGECRTQDGEVHDKGLF